MLKRLVKFVCGESKLEDAGWTMMLWLRRRLTGAGHLPIGRLNGCRQRFSVGSHVGSSVGTSSLNLLRFINASLQTPARSIC